MGIIAALARAGFPIEATRVFAHALPKREAVWWACMCAAHTAPAQSAEGDLKARELSETWVRQQSDDTRRAAMEEAKRTGFQSPEAWAAVAAFWSGDSLAPPNVPPVPPPAHLTGVAVAGAVALASVRARPTARIIGLLYSCNPPRTSPPAAPAGCKWKPHDPHPSASCVARTRCPPKPNASPAGNCASAAARTMTGSCRMPTACCPKNIA